MEKNFSKIQKELNLKFKNLKLLKFAITHKSYDSMNNYEKFEFLGDRVLGLTISKRLIDLYPNENVGILDKKLASLVNQNTCFKVGQNLNLKDYIYLGNKKKNNNLVQKKIVSDCIEALIGSIYLDSGFFTAEQFILKNWETYINESIITQIDSKTRLQEYSLKKFKILPTYKLISNTGPRHNPLFKVAVKIKNTKFIEGSGNSKKKAEQSAASKFLKVYKNELAR